MEVWICFICSLLPVLLRLSVAPGTRRWCFSARFSNIHGCYAAYPWESLSVLSFRAYLLLILLANHIMARRIHLRPSQISQCLSAALSLLGAAGMQVRIACARRARVPLITLETYQ